MERSESIKSLADALSKCQATIESARKSSDNPFFKSKYADLSEVWDVLRKPLTDNGLSISQFPATSDNNKIKITSILMHNSGEFISEVF